MENAGLELKGPMRQGGIKRNYVQGTEYSQDLRLRISPFNSSPAYSSSQRPHSFISILTINDERRKSATSNGLL